MLRYIYSITSFIHRSSGLILLTIALSSSPANSQDSVDGQYLIKYSDGLSEIHADIISEAVGFDSVESISQDDILLGIESTRRPLDKKTIKDLLAAGIVEIFEPNYILKASARPNDTHYTELWGLNNSGGSGGTEDVDIDAPEAWELTTGASNMVIGVIDTGVHYDHPDLANNMWRNPREIPGNGIDDDNNGIIDDVYGYNAINNSGNPLDDNGHGTHCAGTVAAVGNNNTGVTGVAFGAKIMALKILSASGSGYTSDAIKAINYAIGQKQKGVNIRVLSNSWGGPDNSVALQNAVSQAASNGIMFIVAAGNEATNNDSTPSYPANYNTPNVISVAAVDRAGNLASFSNYGSSKVHVAAPGVGILSTVLGNKYAKYNGTSMATPHVAGVAALLLSREPSLSVSTVKTRIISSVKPLSSLHGLVQSGGIVSAYRALGSTLTPAPPTSSVTYRIKQLTPSSDNDYGTRITTGDDSQVTANLAFYFPFYGTNYLKLEISSNGKIVPTNNSSTVNLAADYNNSVTAGINVLNDDYVASPFSANGGVWLKADSDKATITWIVTPYAFINSNDPVNEMIFQAILDKSGKIRYNFIDTNTSSSAYSDGASATVSISPMTDGNGETLVISHNSRNSTYLTSNKSIELSTVTKAVFSDFDGDGRSDLIVWRPSTAIWYILKSSTGFDFAKADNYQWGFPDDKPLIGDFDGDMIADLAVWRPSDGTWYLKTSSTNFQQGTAIQWGMEGDIPLTGDVDGDRISDLMVYRQSTGSFYVLLSSAGFNRAAALAGSSTAARQINVGGIANDPLLGDFDGNGTEEFTTIWQLIRFWQIKNINNSYVSSLPWGIPGDTPRACDFNNDGIDDRIALRPNAGYTIDWFGALGGGGYSSFTFGSLGDIPGCRHDYDGDGVSDAVMFRPNSGNWFIRDGRTNNLISHQFGLPGDIPLVY